MADNRMSKIRVSKRLNMPFYQKALWYSAAIVLSLAVGGVLLALQDVNPFVYYKDMFTIGLIGNAFPETAIEGLLKVAEPLMLTSLALSVSFKIRFWNIGGEGQFIFGAIAAGAVALTAGRSLGMPAVLLLMFVAGALAGGLYGLIPGLLKVRFGTNETLMTLMLNYIALAVLTFFSETKEGWNFFLSDESVRPLFAKFPESGRMLQLAFGSFSLNVSFVITVLLFVLAYFYLNRTKQGYEIAVVGDSADTARYAGMKVKKIVIRTVFLSAAAIGLAGAFTASSSQMLSTTITNSVGWTGIIVAWLSKLSVPGIFCTSLLVSILRYGTTAAGASFPSIDANFVDLLQGVILFTVLGADFLTRFSLSVSGKTAAQEKEEA